MEKYKLDPQLSEHFLLEITAMTRENSLIEKHGKFHHLGY